jgi:BirA family transcriptional regulator, biotin operon repressor / biotin---[acetyl-CoA-carboxylase] ligase
MSEAEIRSGPIGTRFGQIRTFEQLDSTNRYLLEQAEAGVSSGTVVVARDQTSGRGRMGRVWDSKPGSSLLFSVLFRADAQMPAHRHGQAVGLAVLDACQLYGGFKASLKWPNDVLVDGRKLAGILVEASTTTNQGPIVVGCGFNLNWDGGLPGALSDQAISADEVVGEPLDADAMLDHILKALEERLRLAHWLPEAYRQRCSTIGHEVRIETIDSDFTGTALDVADNGALILQEGTNDPVEVFSGEVVHLRKV